MTPVRRLSILLLLCVCFSQRLTAQSDPGPVPDPLPGDFTEIISFLSSDQLEGRGTGDHGARIAAEYIASRMLLAGLLPVGPSLMNRNPRTDTAVNFGYFQDFSGLRCRVEEVSLELISYTAREGKSVRFISGTACRAAAIPDDVQAEASLVFAGYGLDVPEAGYCDYTGLAVKNKIVILVDGYPGHSDTMAQVRKKEGFTLLERASSLKKKVFTAQQRGAIGILLVDPSLPLATADSVFNKLELDDPGYFVPDDPATPTIPLLVLSGEAFRQVTEGTTIFIREFEEKVARTGLPVSSKIKGKTVRLSVRVKTENILLRNVVGMIPGDNTTLTIVVGAHYDHLGIIDGRIYNGADDNASGVAGMLALAKAWANHRGRPACNMVFAAWTGEEVGKLGSSYFCRHAPIVPGRTSLAINMDMISRSAPEDTGRIMLSAGTMTGNSDLRALVSRLNASFDRPFILDLWDITGASGSDYRPFADRKVPILTFHAGFPPQYHTPEDDFSKVDLHKMEQVLKLVNGCIRQSILTPPAREP